MFSVRVRLLVINENMLETLEKFGSYIMPGTQAEKSAVYVPLVVGDQARGLVSLSDFEREHAFSDSDVRLLQTLVNSMSVALENARLFDETQRLLQETTQRNNELAIINDIQRGLASKLDLQSIIDLVGENVRKIFMADGTVISLYDSSTRMLNTLYQILGEYREHEEIHPLEPSLTARVIETRQPLLIGTMEEALALGAIVQNIGPDATDPDEQNANSTMFVPLLSGSEVTGVINVSRFKKNSYTENDLRLLQTLASSLSVALENARLFNETQRLLGETEQRNNELAIINEIQDGLVSKLDFQAIVDLVGEKLRQVFNAPDLCIYWYDEKADLLHYLYTYEHGERLTVAPEPNFPGSLVDLMLKNNSQPVVSNTLAEYERLAIPLIDGTDQSKSMAYVPIISGDRLIGMIGIENYERENAFGDAEVRLLSTIAASLGTALENANLFTETQRLLQETEQRNRELAIISRVGQELVGQLDPQGIFELVGDELGQVFDAQVVAIITYNKPEDLFHWRYSIEKGEKQFIPAVKPSGFSGHILHTRQPLLITKDLAERAAELGSTVLAGEAPKSYLGVPLVAGGEVTGVISLQNIDREDAFSENDLSLLSTLALNMGVALENARLYQETQRHAVEMAALAEIGSDIASTHEMEPVLQRLAAKTRDLLQVRDINLFLLQPDGHTLSPIVALGKYTEETLALPLQLGEGVTGDIARSGMAEIVNYPEDDQRAVHIAGTPQMSDELECMMVAPLISRGRVIGVMSAYRDREQGLFTQLELDFLVSLARQAAIAIESARLYTETELRASQMATLAEVGREISATLELPAVLETIAGQARELLSAGTSAVYLLQPDDVTLKAIVALGDVAPEVLADVSTLGEGIIGNIVKNGNAEFVNDTSRDPRGIHIEGTEDIDEGEKLLVAPLLVQERAIGALAVWRDPEDAPFDQAELSFSIGLAQQAAVAIENARLFENAQETQRRMADIIDFLPDATLVIDRQGKVIAWNRAMEEMTGITAGEMLGKGDYEYALPFYGERQPILVDMVFESQSEFEQNYAQIQRHGIRPDR